MRREEESDAQTARKKNCTWSKEEDEEHQLLLQPVREMIDMGVLWGRGVLSQRMRDCKTSETGGSAERPLLMCGRRCAVLSAAGFKKDKLSVFD